MEDKGPPTQENNTEPSDSAVITQVTYEVNPAIYGYDLYGVNDVEQYGRNGTIHSEAAVPDWWTSVAGHDTRFVAGDGSAPPSHGSIDYHAMAHGLASPRPKKRRAHTCIVHFVKFGLPCTVVSLIVLHGLLLPYAAKTTLEGRRDYFPAKVQRGLAANLTGLTIAVLGSLLFGLAASIFRSNQETRKLYCYGSLSTLLGIVSIVYTVFCAMSSPLLIDRPDVVSVNLNVHNSCMFFEMTDTNTKTLEEQAEEHDDAEASKVGTAVTAVGTISNNTSRTSTTSATGGSSPTTALPVEVVRSDNKTTTTPNNGTTSTSTFPYNVFVVESFTVHKKTPKRTDWKFWVDDDTKDEEQGEDEDGHDGTEVHNSDGVNVEYNNFLVIHHIHSVLQPTMLDVVADAGKNLEWEVTQRSPIRARPTWEFENITVVTIIVRDVPSEYLTLNVSYWAAVRAQLTEGEGLKYRWHQVVSSKCDVLVNVNILYNSNTTNNHNGSDPSSSTASPSPSSSMNSTWTLISSPALVLTNSVTMETHPQSSSCVEHTSNKDVPSSNSSSGSQQQPTQQAAPAGNGNNTPPPLTAAEPTQTEATKKLDTDGVNSGSTPQVTTTSRFRRLQQTTKKPKKESKNKNNNTTQTPSLNCSSSNPQNPQTMILNTYSSQRREIKVGDVVNFEFTIPTSDLATATIDTQNEGNEDPQVCEIPPPELRDVKWLWIGVLYVMFFTNIVEGTCLLCLASVLCFVMGLYCAKSKKWRWCVPILLLLSLVFFVGILGLPTLIVMLTSTREKL